MSAAFDVPPFAVVAAGLRNTTERLATEISEGSTATPDWSPFEWTIAQSSAAMQGIAVLLANRVSWSGPPSWQAFLAEQREQGVLRDACVGALVERIDAKTRERGIVCVALKGAALRTLDFYAPGERPMGDIDLLVASRDLQPMAAVMSDIDYVEAFTTRRHRVYEPRFKKAPRGFGEHIDNPLKIEVHTVIAEQLPVHAVDITSRLKPARPRQGLNSYPDLVSLLLHQLLHAAGNMRAHAVRQIQLHDIAMVANSFHEQDWRALLEPRNETDERWWLFPPLALAARYYRESIPAEVLQAARSACPRVLRLAAARQSLTDVSWSNLRIHAFPGIEWARTPLDAMRFVRARVLPGRRSLAELEFARQAQPQLDQVPWYGVSHGSRILRWLFSRPPRVQTITSVMAALRDARSQGRV